MKKLAAVLLAAALAMPAMTMVFQIKDPAMLEQVKAGDKVTRIEPAK